MSSLDNDWFSFGGDARPGRVPGQVIVKGPQGYGLTASQRGEFSQVFRQFTTSVRTSPIPDGFHIKRMRLGDGSRIEMVANNGVYQTVIYPAVGGGGGAPPGFHGFLFLPTIVYWIEKNIPSVWFKAQIYGALGYAAQQPPPALAGDPPQPGGVRARYPLTDWGLDRFPGSCSWRGGKSFDNTVLNWRGPPRKYMPFSSFVSWGTYTAVAEDTGTSKQAAVGGLVDTLHRVSGRVWVNGAVKRTPIPFIFTACLHRPQGDAKPNNVILRVLGTEAIGSTGFKVYDLVPTGRTLENSTLEAIRNVGELIVQKSYTPTGLHAGGPSTQLQPGTWTFVWAPTFNSLGNKLAACVREVQPQHNGEGNIVCEMDATTFATSNRQHSRVENSHSGTTSETVDDTVEGHWRFQDGVEVLVWPIMAQSGSSVSTQAGRYYVGCDYDNEQFASLWIEQQYSGSSEGSAYWEFEGAQPVSVARSSSYTSSTTTKVVHSTYGVLTSASSSESGSSSVVSYVGTGSVSATERVGYEITADLSIGAVHVLTSTSRFPAMSQPSPPPTIAVELESKIWLQGHSVGLSSRTYTYEGQGWAPYHPPLNDYIGYGTGGDHPYTNNSVSYSSGIEFGFRHYDYRTLAVTRGGKGVYLGRAILRGNDSFDGADAVRGYGNEGAFLSAVATAPGEAPSFNVWPAPWWFEDEPPSQYQAFVAPVFI